MPEDSRVEELLDRWEDLHDEGESLTVADFVARFCESDGSETVEAFKTQIAAIAFVDQILAEAPPDESLENANLRNADSTNGLFEFEEGAEPVAGYRLVSPLGSGGFGDVWKASGPGGFQVALKFVRMNRPGGGAESELQALEILKRIRHPNILTTFGTWRKGDWLIIAAELAGQSLYDRLRNLKEQGTNGIPHRELLAYMKDIARAIDFLNKRQHRTPEGGKSPIQHRDIKPQNLLLSGGSVKIADLGIATHVRRNVTGQIGAMTPAFAPPEAYNNETSDSYDQYSLAVTYCLLRGGRLPFRRTDMEIVRGHISGLPDLSMLPEAERPIVNRALSKKPAERWPSCMAFISAIEDVPRSAPAILDTTPPPLSEYQRRQSRQKAGVFVAILLLMMAVAGMAWYAGTLTSKTESDSMDADGKHATAKNNKNTTPVDRTKKTLPIKRVAVKSSSSAPPIKKPIVRTPVVAKRPKVDSKKPLQPKFVVVRNYLGHTAPIRSVAISPDGSHILSG